MKKFLALLLAVVMVLTMVACGEGKKKADGQVVIGTSTEASGDWAYSAFVRNPNATDKAVWLPTSSTAILTNFPAVSARESALHAVWLLIPSLSFAMRQFPHWMYPFSHRLSTC